MTATTHAVVGTVIAAKVGDPFIAIPLALISHIVLDMIPHWDTLTNRREKGKMRTFFDSLLDVSLGLFLSFIIITYIFPGTDPAYTLLIIFASVVQDLLAVPYLFFDWKFFPFYNFYKFSKITDNRLNHGIKLNNIWGKLDQVGIIAGFIVLAKIF